MVAQGRCMMYYMMQVRTEDALHDGPSLQWDDENGDFPVSYTIW
jgi:hypothetical protein